MTLTTTTDPRIDRLYQLLPAIDRMRDAEQGYPLQALLRVIAEQVNVVEDDIARLYENWFIETAETWAVPYLGDLIGYRPVIDPNTLMASGSTSPGFLEALAPRREVANTVRYRRRKGTSYVLELLANDIAGWPACAVEFFKRLAWNQNVQHLHLDRARTVDVRLPEVLEPLEGPFDGLAHTVDVRRISSRRTRGRDNIPSVGLFVWRLKRYSVTGAGAYCAEDAGPHCLTFSVLGQDTPLFQRPEPETDPTHIAEEPNVPAAIRRRAFERHKERYYGTARSFVIWAPGWGGLDADTPIPVESVIPADLSDWGYVPPPRRVAVDPVLGRMAFPPGQLPKKGVRVNYGYGFSADMGGGEYSREILDPSPRVVETTDPQNADTTVRVESEPRLYRVGSGQTLKSLRDAVERWRHENPWDAVIEITDSAVYAEPMSLAIGANRTLQIRAANAKRPVFWLADWQPHLPDALSVTMGAGSRFTLDGLLITGRPLYVTGPDRDSSSDAPEVCGSELVIRHCTLVPGWGIDCDCEPRRPGDASLEVFQLRCAVRIEHSIVGPILVHEDEVRIDPIPIRVSDSILDATAADRHAIAAPGGGRAHASLSIERTTVYGIVETNAIELASNSIFTGCVNVVHRQTGCMRFCYVPPKCETPRRYECQPDQAVREAEARAQAEAEAVGAKADPETPEIRAAREQVRVRPQFTSERYGSPGYAQLGFGCASEITRGAEDESEMGAFHDLYQPQREAILRARLDEFTPAEMQSAIVFAT